MSSNFKPFRDHILVKRETSDQSNFSIQRISNSSPLLNEGTVVAVGDGRLNPHNTTETIPLEVKVGDKVAFAPNVGYDIKIEDAGLKGNDIFSYGEKSQYILIRESDILGFRFDNQ